MFHRLAMAALLAVALLGSSWLMAQEAKTGKGRGTMPANWGKLGLSDEQKKQVYSIQTDYRGKIDALQVQIDDLKKKEKTELSKVLTPAQRARLKEILASKAGSDTADVKKDNK